MFKTYVINLDKDKERLSFMDQQLKSLGIVYLRQPAVLGIEYKPSIFEYDEKLALSKGGHKLLPGEIGCAISHVEVLKKIVEEEIPYALVLEDDVSLPEKFKEIIENEITKNKKGNKWEYLLFNYATVGKPFLYLWFAGIKYNYKGLGANYFIKMKFILFHLLKAAYIIPLSFYEAARNKYKMNNPGPVKFFRPVYYAGAYLLTLDGAKKLLALNTPVIYTADHLPNRARVMKGLIFRGFAPLVVFQKRLVFGSSLLGISGEEIKKIYGKEPGQ